MTATPRKTAMLPLLAATFLLPACGGEFAFKRGASADDLASAKAACQAKGSEAAMEKCLEQHGWLVHKMDGGAPLDEAPVATMAASDNRTGAPVVSGSGSDQAAPDQAAGTTGAGTPPAETGGGALPKDPLDVFKVSSWWKMGGSESALKSDVDGCVATLGEAHKPDSAMQQATRGLLVCMRQKGWYALQAK